MYYHFKGLTMFLFDFFKRRASKASSANQSSDRGILVFENTSEVIRAESILKSGGWNIRVMGPPPEIRTGCDLVIEFPLIEELKILTILRKDGVRPLEIVPVSSPLLQPVNIFQNKDFGKYSMIRAANMKLTIDKETHTVVNISGGGCPDVPYLAHEIVGKPMAEAPSPREIGHTLCGYALQLAFEEMLRRCSQ